MTPAGVVTEFPVPTDNSKPFGIAAGPDGNIWFAESNGNKIGRFRVSRTDLMVAVSPRSATGTAGQGLTYTITVTNDGPVEATDVVLTEDYVPTAIPVPQPAATYSATTSQGTVKAAPFLAQIGSLASGASATVTIVMNVSAPFTFMSRFVVHANESDTNPANDTDMLSVTIGPATHSNSHSTSPLVLGLRSVRVKRRGLTAIVVNFDQPMNPGSLGNIGIYHLVAVSKGKKSRESRRPLLGEL